MVGKVVKDLCILLYDPANPLIIDEINHHIHALLKYLIGQEVLPKDRMVDMYNFEKKRALR